MAKRFLRSGMGDLRDFVRAGFPEPMNPLRVNWDPNFAAQGMGALSDFVLASFPEPFNPIYNNGLSGCGGSCGGSCGGCAGMGLIAEPAWTANLPTFLQGSAAGVPIVYWGLGGLGALVLGPMIFSRGRGRR